MTSKKRSGRQRSDQATHKIREAALKLASELGPERVTIEGISTEAGVAKTTIYRRWPNAASAIMDAFLSDLDPLIRYRKDASLRETMTRALSDFAVSLTKNRKQLLRHLIAAAQSDPDIATAFWKNWIEPRRKEGIEVITGYGRSVKEAELILDLLFGAFYYRLLIPYAEIDQSWIREIAIKVLESERRDF